MSTSESFRVTSVTLAVAIEGDHQTVIMIQPGSEIVVTCYLPELGLVEAQFRNQSVRMQRKDLDSAEAIQDAGLFLQQTA